MPDRFEESVIEGLATLRANQGHIIENQKELIASDKAQWPLLVLALTGATLAVAMVLADGRPVAVGLAAAGAVLSFALRQAIKAWMA